MQQKVVFSGDLGAPYSPLLNAPRSPYSADVWVIESTYGDRNHDSRRQRRQRLSKIIKKAFENRGVVLIPAFSIGRTQELLYELEELIHHHYQQISKGLTWQDLDILIDSPLAARFTRAYRKLSPYWDKEARYKLQQHRHPLSFEQLTTIESHQDHQRAAKPLSRRL